MRSVDGEALTLLSRIRLVHVLGSQHSVVCAPWLKRFCSLLLFFWRAAGEGSEQTCQGLGEAALRTSSAACPEPMGLMKGFIAFSTRC